MMTKRFQRDITLSLIIGFTFCFFFTHALALNPFTLYCGYDSSVFEQMGLGMLQGRIPYVDLFDHKGFLLYIINAIGLWISPGHTGIYCLLSLYLAATFLCWLSISDFLVNPSLRYFPPVIALLFALTCEGGNLTETWSLWALSLPIYYLVRYVSSEQMICLREYFFIGVCIGIVANLRLNNVAPAIAVCIYMFIDFCIRKDFQGLTRSVLSIAGGFLLVTLVLVAIYVGLYGAEYLEDYWYGNIGFNLLYVDRFAHEPLWEATGLYFPLFMLIVMLCLPKNYQNRLMWFTLWAFLLTLITTGTAYFAHYFTLFAPFVVLSTSLSIGRSLDISKKNWCLIGVGLVILFVGLYGIFHRNISLKIDDFLTRERAIAECSHKIRELSKKQKRSIWNYNTMMAGSNILQNSEIVQCNRIFLPFQNRGQFGVANNSSLEETCPEVMLIDDFTRWSAEPACDTFGSREESVGCPKDSVFIAENYHLLYRCQTLIQGKRVCIYIRN